MTHRIKKLAVLGSGVMGSGIACHFANIGMDVLLLDIVPRDLDDNEKTKPSARNRIVDGALKSAIKSKPAALYSKSFVHRITTGNPSRDCSCGHRIGQTGSVRKANGPGYGRSPGNDAGSRSGRCSQYGGLQLCAHARHAICAPIDRTGRDWGHHMVSR